MQYNLYSRKQRKTNKYKMCELFIRTQITYVRHLKHDVFLCQRSDEESLNKYSKKKMKAFCRSIKQLSYYM